MFNSSINDLSLQVWEYKPKWNLDSSETPNLKRHMQYCLHTFGKFVLAYTWIQKKFYSLNLNLKAKEHNAKISYKML